MDSDDMIPFGPDANCTLDTCPLEWTVYQYRPSLPANIFFMAAYFVSIMVHLACGLQGKNWWFVIFMTLGSINEIIGYAGRIMMYYNPFSFAGFMMQIICVTSGPVYYTAAIYVTISKTITNLNPTLSRIKPNLYYWIFITSDLVALVLQAVGGAMSTDSAGKSDVAVHLALAGLVWQVAALTIFSGLYIEFMVRYHRHSRRGDGVQNSPRLQVFLGSLSLAILLILVRSCYRVAELNQGYTGALIHDEALFIALEGVLIVIAVYVLCFSNPGFVFRGSRAGKRDREAKNTSDSG